jgi:hypothetical protein
MSIRKSIAQLIVSLGLDSASYKTGLKNAKKDAHGFSASARQAFNSARTGVNQAGMAVTAAAATVTAATAVMVKQQMQQIDQLAKFSDRLGITTVALSGLRHQAELNGVAQNQLDTGLQRMVRRVAEAAKGTGEAVKALDELGMSAQQLSRLSPEKQFAAIADKMKDVDGQSNRVRLAFKLFDAEGVGMVNMMRDGAEGLAAAQAEAVGLGIAINRIDAAKIEAANDATYRAKSAMDGLGKSITIAVTPYITEIANEFFNAGKESNGFRDQVTAGMEIAVTAVGYVSNAVRGMHILWKGAQVLVAGFAANTLEMLSNVRTKLAEVANMIPGVTVDVLPDTGIALMAQVARDQLETLKVELHELAMQELPSEASDRWFKRVQAQADEAARKVASVQAQINSGGADAPEDITESGEVSSLDKTLESELNKNATYEDVFARRQEMLANSLRSNQITEQRYAEVSLKNLQIYNRARTEAIQSNHSAMISSSLGFFANMATLSEHGNKNLARIGKAAAAVNIVISTIDAAQSSFAAAAKWGGPVAGAAAATAAVVAGMMRLRQLNQVQPGGSASLSAGGLSGQTNFDQNLPSASSSMPDTAAGINSFNRDTQTQLASREERKAPTVNMIEDASRAGQVQQLTEDDVINIYVSNIHNQGEIARAQETTYQMTRYGT